MSSYDNHPYRQEPSEPLPFELQYMVNNITMDILLGSRMDFELRMRVFETLRYHSLSPVWADFELLYPYRSYNGPFTAAASQLSTLPSGIPGQLLTQAQVHRLASLDLDGWGREQLQRDFTARNFVVDLIHALRIDQTLLQEFINTLPLAYAPLAAAPAPALPTVPTFGYPPGPSSRYKPEDQVLGLDAHLFDYNPNFFENGWLQEDLQEDPSQNLINDGSFEDQLQSEYDTEEDSPVDPPAAPPQSTLQPETRHWYCTCGSIRRGWKDHHSHIFNHHGRSDRRSGEEEQKKEDIYMTAEEAAAKGLTDEVRGDLLKQTEVERTKMQKGAKEWKQKKINMKAEDYERLAQREDGYPDFDERWIGKYKTKK